MCAASIHEAAGPDVDLVVGVPVRVGCAQAGVGGSDIYIYIQQKIGSFSIITICFSLIKIKIIIIIPFCIFIKCVVSIN